MHQLPPATLRCGPQYCRGDGLRDLNRRGSQVRGIFQRVLKLLTFTQIVEPEPVFNGFVREIHFASVVTFDEAVALVVVVGNKSRVGLVTLLRQMNELDERSGWHLNLLIRLQRLAARSD